MKQIDLSMIESKKYKVLSGVELGKKARKLFEIDKLDDAEEQIILVIPHDVFSLNSSFFSGLFHGSIVKLKEEGFRKKYLFNCNDVIRKNVEDGIFYVLNTKNLLEDKK